MIELTVKTLDSQNHGFSVPDDTTVKQLKEKIAESINIPADSQRLIYCGRVLVDEKNLSEYDVSGKVIHLVHRPPPQATRPNGNNSGGRPPNQQQRRTNQHHRQPRMDGNAMYLGAMAFPADLMDAQGIQPPQPSHNLSQSRLIVARRMVRRASAVLQRLEWPGIQESPDPETPPEDVENGSGSNGENSGNGGSAVLTQAQPFAGSIAQAAQAATAAAIAAAVSAAHAAGVPNITIVRGGQAQGSQETVNIRIEGSGSEEGTRAEQDQQVSSSEAGEATTQATQHTSSDPNSASGSENQSRRSIEYPRTNDMAALLDDLNRVTERMQPFLQQYHQLMRDDPVFEPDSPALQDAQRVFNSVSEVMHFLSHAYHAMSDIMCEFSGPPPRNLRCRPVLIQHSAVLQAGIPIQAQINVMANRQNAGNNSQPSTHVENDNSPSANSLPIPNTTSAAPSAPPDSGASAVQSETAGSNTNQTQDAPQAQSERQQVSSEAQNSEQNFVPQPTFNITPGNVEFFMEVGPGSITIDSLETTVVTNGNTGGSPGGIDPNVVGGSFPWGSPPPPEFVQNLMQAVAGHVIGRTGNAPSTSGTTQAAAGAGGQNSQARGNTATHPTTSTQTRSTSRPHVHLAPAAMQGLSSTNFDPFLPCNSHHVRTFRRRQRVAQQAHQQSTGAASSEPHVEVQVSEQVAEQPQQQPQPSQDASNHPPQPPPTPQPQPPPQAQPQPQPQPQANSLFSFISNIIGNVRGGPPGMGMGSFSFQVPPSSMPPPPPSRPSNMQSASAAGSGPANQPPGLSFLSLMNMMTGQGSSGARSRTVAVAGETPVINIPIMTQMFENLSGGLGGAFFVQGSGPTLGDFLQSIPDDSYTEGESIFGDLAMTLARSLTFQDLIAQRFGHVDSLNHIHPQLREFVGQRVLQGETPTPENIARGADRLIREMRPHFDIMLEARLREEVDLVATANRYNQIRLPQVITLIMAEGNSNNFGRELVRWWRTYIGEISAILMHCCVDKIQGLVTVMQNYVQRLTSGVQPSVQQWTVGSSVTHLRNYLSQLDVPFEDIQRYLVYRIPGTAEPPVPPSSSVPVQESLVHAERVEATAVPEPMETDGVASECNRITVPLQNKDVQDQGLAMDTDTLPDVLLGSEAWHTTLPSDWVPIITRDTQRQRRQNPQPPFSDAYLAGMPSKRRKIVTSAKPQGSLSQIIGDGVGNAVDAAGVDAVTGLETVTQVAGNDPEIQAAYRDQVRLTVRENLASNPDFTAEQFPNTAKYFK